MEHEYILHSKLERNDIRPEEKLALIDQNPTITYKTPHVQFGEGRQSRVSALEIHKNTSVTKVIWKRCGVDKGLTESESKELCSRISPYRTVLQEHGWNVPEIYYSQPVQLAKEHVIFSYEHLIESVDVERMFKDEGTAHFERLSVIQKMISTLTNRHHARLQEEVYGDYILSSLPYGIDLKLANLILDHHGTLHFVDFFGPKEILPGGSWKSYTTKLDSLSEDRLKMVCATREGCILRMIKLALKNLPVTLSKETYFHHFLDSILLSDLPQREKDFIVQEITLNFPMLDKVYEEYRV